jgi:hypothetical protein
MPLADAPEQAGRGAPADIASILLLHLTERSTRTPPHGLAKLIGSRVNLRRVLGCARKRRKGLLIGRRLSLAGILALL